ncbi:hypothetical protein KSS87_017851 [Heliosperma pusillum]|nr:hypothetical protein KSS87_017851 [Heliosperma pusillum]
MLSPQNVKVLFRRGIAFTKLKRFSEDELDLLEALVVEPKNKDVVRELDVVKNYLLMKENGKRTLEVAYMVEVDRINKKLFQVAESSMKSNNLESVSIEEPNDYSTCGTKSGNERVNMELMNDLSVGVTDLDTSLKNEQIYIKSILESSKRGEIPLESPGSTTRESCKKKNKRRRRCPRKGNYKNSKNLVVNKEESPPLDIINMNPAGSCTSSSASSLGDNFISPDTQIIQEPLKVIVHDSGLAFAHVIDHNATSSCLKSHFHLQKSRCSACAFPAARTRKYNWSVKAIRRKTTGTGRMRYLRNVPRRFKTGFREGTQAAPRKQVAAASS